MIGIDDALSYFHNERLFSDDFINADTKKQEQALNMATNQIFRLRLNKNMDLEKEEDIFKAICEQALYLIQTQNTQRSRLIEQGVTSFSVEGLSESYDTSKIKSSATNKICSEAMAYLRPYMIGCAQIC